MQISLTKLSCMRNAVMESLNGNKESAESHPFFNFN